MNTNLFGTSPTDCLGLDDCITQVTADTGFTVIIVSRNQFLIIIVWGNDGKCIEVL